MSFDNLKFKTYKKEIEEGIGYQFKDKEFLKSLQGNRFILTPQQQRLEFFGDSVLDVIIAQYGIKELPFNTEGELTVFKSRIISAVGLKKRFQESFPILYKVLCKNGISTKRYGDIIECFIAQIFIETDYETCKQIILSFFEKDLEESSKKTIKREKPALQGSYKQQLIKRIRNITGKNPTFRRETYKENSVMQVQLSISVKGEVLFCSDRTTCHSRKFFENYISHKILNSMELNKSS